MLGEFAAAFYFGDSKIKTLRGLVGSLRKSASSDPLAHELIAAADEATVGWLALFSAYRNVFTHNAPLEQAAGIALTVQDTRVISPTLSVPQIYYPLPPEPIELSRQHSRGPRFATLEELTNASAGRRPDRTFEPDALDYLWSCLDQFGLLAQSLATHSPVPPEPIRLGPDDIIGDIKFSSRFG